MAHVQSTTDTANHSSGTTASSLFSSNVTSGNLVVIAVMTVNATAVDDVTAISGLGVPSSGAGAWTRLGSVFRSGPGDVEIWAGISAGGSKSLTVTSSAGSTFRAAGEEFSGEPMPSFFTSATGTSATNPSITFDTFGANTIAFAVASINGTLSGGPASPWVINTAQAHLNDAYNVGPSPGALTTTWTAASNWSAAACLIGAVDTDTGSGADAAQSIVLKDADSGSGSDSQVVVWFGSDTGTGADAVTGLTLSGVAETGSGAEANPLVKLNSSDTGSGSESQSFAIFGSDSGSGLDAVLNLILSGVSDSGSGIEANPSIHLVHADTGSGAEAVLSITLGSTDLGSGTDAVQRLLLQALESGSGADAVASLALLAAESGSGIETESINAIVISADSGSGAETEVILRFVLVFDSDSGSGHETEAIAARVTDAEVMVLTEAWNNYTLPNPEAVGTPRDPGRWRVVHVVTRGMDGEAAHYRNQLVKRPWQR